MNLALIEKANQLNNEAINDVGMATFMRRIGDYDRMRELMNTAMDKAQQADTALKAAFSTGENHA